MRCCHLADYHLHIFTLSFLFLPSSSLSLTSFLIYFNGFLAFLISPSASSHPNVLMPCDLPLHQLPSDPFPPPPLLLIRLLLFSPTRFATALTLKIFPRHGNAPPPCSLQCQRCRRRPRGCETTPDFTFPLLMFHLSAVVGNDSVRSLSSRPLSFDPRISPFAGVQRVQGACERGAVWSHSV